MNDLKNKCDLSDLYVGLFIVVLVTLAFLTTPVTQEQHGFASDGNFYAVMAGSTVYPQSLADLSPWCYRVLTPFLASLLPWPLLDNFRILAFISNIISLFLIFLILKKFKFSRDMCLLGVLFYGGIFWTLKFPFYYPAYIDFQTQLFLLLIIYLTISGRYVFLLFLFPISVLQKESLALYSFFSVFHFLKYRDKKPGSRAVMYVTAVILLPFATIFLVRCLVYAENSHSLLVMLEEIVKLGDIEFWPIFIQAIFSGLGIIPVLLLTGYKEWGRHLRKYPEWVVYLLISLFFLFGGVDKARLFLYSLPLAVFISIHLCSNLKKRLLPWKFNLWISFILLVHWFLGGYLTPRVTFNNYLGLMLPVHSRGRYVPFLIRNVIIALIVFLFTLFFLRAQRKKKK